MGNAYVLTLEPTFTQGLIIGQFSILFLLFVILKYLFFDFASGPSAKFSYQPRLVINEVDDILDGVRDKPRRGTDGSEPRSGDIALESTDWLNVVLQQVLDAYRMKLRGHSPGLDGDELARRRVEEFANKIRPAGFLDRIKVHSVDLGTTAPRLSAARRKICSPPSSDQQLEFDLNYSDSVSVSLSTSVLFNYPFSSFARLPVSLTITLSLFSAAAQLTPPDPHSEHPVMTIILPSPQSEFVLDLKTSSLMGSRAKLADVPKLHELITHQIRKVIIDKGVWKVAMPGLATVAEVRQDIEIEQKERAMDLLAQV